MKGDPSAARVEGVERVASTKYLCLEQVRFTSPFGTSRVWDRVARVPQSHGDGSSRSSTLRTEGQDEIAENTRKPVCDAVAIFAVMTSRKRPEQEPETVIVKQFRPAVGKMTVELPAGLVDVGESPGVAALRELREETGLVGHLLGISPVTYLSPGLSSESICVVVVKVDLDDPQNEALPTVVEREDDDEYIETEHVALSKLLVRLDALSEQGLAVFSGLYSLAFGLSLGWTQLPSLLDST